MIMLLFGDERDFLLKKIYGLLVVWNFCCIEYDCFKSIYHYMFVIIIKLLAFYFIVYSRGFYKICVCSDYSCLTEYCYACALIWLPVLISYCFTMQIINVYNQEYESGAAFWPDVHGRVISALIISQLLLMGLLSTKENAQLTPFLIALPVLTIWFHRYCKGRYEPAFVKYPLQVCKILLFSKCLFCYLSRRRLRLPVLI